MGVGGGGGGGGRERWVEESLRVFGGFKRVLERAGVLLRLKDNLKMEVTLFKAILQMFKFWEYDTTSREKCTLFS